MFSNDRNELRKMFFTAWQKHRAGEAMQPLEQVIAQTVSQHPEYHRVVENEDSYIDKDYMPEMGETNPFLHMSMHIAIHEQVSTGRPAGILAIYQQLIGQHGGDAHAAEHLMMECLGEMLWQAQRQHRTPDEQDYLACLNKQLSTK